MNLSTKISVATLITLATTLYPVAYWVDNRYMHVEAAERYQETNSIKLQELDLKIQRSANEINIRRLSNKMISGQKLTPYEESDFDILQEERLRLQEYQRELNRLK